MPDFRNLSEGTKSFFGGVSCEDSDTPIAK